MFSSSILYEYISDKLMFKLILIVMLMILSMEIMVTIILIQTQILIIIPLTIILQQIKYKKEGVRNN